jgi:uncharacterized protein
MHMEEYFVLILIILVFSIIQSFFGVGLLVFGTPSLLLLGYSFDVALTYLLPSSIIISFIQVLQSKASLTLLQKKLLLYSVPGIIIGLIFVISGFISINIGVVVGIMLIISVLFRNIKSLFTFLKRVFNSKLNTYVFIMGLIHGVSNMGGGFLTILVTTLFDKKEEQRKNIAFGYLIFGITQIVILIVFKTQLFTYWSLLFPILSIITYFILGNVIFNKTSDGIYNKLISILIFLYGIVLIFKNIFLINN